MLDLARIVGFEWDAGNARKSLDKHGVSQKEAEEVFQDPDLLILVDDKHSAKEERFLAFGETASGRKLQVSFTLHERASLVRVISARSMSRRERIRYEEEA